MRSKVVYRLLVMALAALGYLVLLLYVPFVIYDLVVDHIEDISLHLVKEVNAYFHHTQAITAKHL